MHDWVPIVRERLEQLTTAVPDSVLVEELAAHLAQVYELLSFQLPVSSSR